MKSCSLGKDERLKKNCEFRQVYEKGQKIVTNYFVLYWMEGKDLNRRIGISVSRKIGCAVKRNRAKRLLREAFRINKNHVSAGVDIIAVGRKGLEEQSFSAVEAIMIGALKRIDFFRKGRAS